MSNSHSNECNDATVDPTCLGTWPSSYRGGVRFPQLCPQPWHLNVIDDWQYHQFQFVPHIFQPLPSPSFSTNEGKDRYLGALGPSFEDCNQGTGSPSPSLSTSSMTSPMPDLATGQQGQPYDEMSMLHDISSSDLFPRSACTSPTTSIAPRSPHQRKGPKRRRKHRSQPRSERVPCTWEGCSNMYGRTQDVRRHIASVSKPKKTPAPSITTVYLPPIYSSPLCQTWKRKPVSTDTYAPHSTMKEQKCRATDASERISAGIS